MEKYNKKIKIIDYFCGLGGTAKGILKYTKEQNVDVEYIGVEYNENISKLFVKNNPSAKVIVGDVYESLDMIKDADFIWLSPPCQSHSRLMLVWKNKPQWKEPDMRLWELISKLKDSGKNFILENVTPYYKPPIKPTIKIGRHCVWSNRKLFSFKYEEPDAKNVFGIWGKEEWAKYHQLETINIKDSTLERQALRNCVHWTISYGLIKQFFSNSNYKTKVPKLSDYY